jgi:hypothetical protein
MKTRKSKLRLSAEIAAYVWFGYLLLQPSWVFSQVPFYQGKTITVIIVIRRKDLLLFLCIPPPNVSGANAAT